MKGYGRNRGGEVRTAAGIIKKKIEKGGELCGGGQFVLPSSTLVGARIFR